MTVNKFNWEIMERRKLSIFPVVLVMQSYTCEMEKLVGVNIKHFLMDYKEGSLTAIRDRDDWQDVSVKVFDYVKKNPDCLEKILSNLRTKVVELSKHADHMAVFDSRPDSDEAVSLFNKYCDIYVKSSVYGECVPFTIKEVLATELNNMLSHYEDSYEISSALSIPAYLTYTMREEIDFYKRLKDYKTNPTKRKEIIENHYRDYAWFKYDYNSSEWSLNDIRDKFEKGTLIQDSEIERTINELANFVSRPGAKEKEYIKRYQIDDYTLMLSNILKTSIILMDLKKEEYTKIHHKTINFFSRVADYLGIDQKYVYYIIPYGYSQIVKAKDANTLVERYKSSTLHLTKDGWDLVHDFDVNAILNKNIGVDSVVKGMCAYPGIIEGKVRVVRSVEDIKSFRDGEVLLTTMTTIDFIEAIKKASAVITDDGGVICHAAIVCREMKKPCVVGTKIATNRFKSGDIVRIDAGNGTISNE